jgi:hypothetical protein
MHTRSLRSRLGTLLAAPALAIILGLLQPGVAGRTLPAPTAGGEVRDEQLPPRPAGPRGNRGQARGAEAADDGGVTTGELVNMLDTYAIVEAQRALSLGDDKYGQFVSRLKRLQDARRRGQRERNQIVQGLRRLVGPQATGPIDEAVVREQLRALRDHDDRSAAEIRTAYDALDEVLDLRQQARFRVFEETIERRKLDLLVRARERAARNGAR